MAVLRFPFAFDREYRLAALLFGVTPANSVVLVDPDEDILVARFGLWRVRTTCSNVVSADITGPYRRITTLGPARLSLADRGLTFAGTAARGVCLSFAEPVPGIEPTARLRHPGLTVTVADPEALVAAVVPQFGR